MLIIFNKSGSEFQIDYQNDSFSQSDSNVHIIDVIIEDETFSNYDHNAYVQFLRNGDQQPSLKYAMTNKKHKYNDKAYNGYRYTMKSDWFTEKSGMLKMTVTIKGYLEDGNETNKAYGIINIPIQESVSPISDVENNITEEQYDALIKLINSKLNRDDYDINKTWFDVEEDFADDILNQVMDEPSERKIFFTSIGDEPIRYEAIGLVYQHSGNYYCNVYSANGINRYIKTESYVNKITFSADDVTLNKLMVYNKASVPAPTEDRDAVNKKYLTDNFYDKENAYNKQQVYNKNETYAKGETYSRNEAIEIGLITASNYNTETGEIEIVYNSGLFDLNYNTETGELEFLYK